MGNFPGWWPEIPFPNSASHFQILHPICSLSELPWGSSAPTKIKRWYLHSVSCWIPSAWIRYLSLSRKWTHCTSVGFKTSFYIFLFYFMLRMGAVGRNLKKCALAQLLLRTRLNFRMILFYYKMEDDPFYYKIQFHYFSWSSKIRPLIICFFFWRGKKTGHWDKFLTTENRKPFRKLCFKKDKL